MQNDKHVLVVAGSSTGRKVNWMPVAAAFQAPIYKRSYSFVGKSALIYLMFTHDGNGSNTVSDVCCVNNDCRVTIERRIFERVVGFGRSLIMSTRR